MRVCRHSYPPAHAAFVQRTLSPRGRARCVHRLNLAGDGDASVKWMDPTAKTESWAGIAPLMQKVEIKPGARVRGPWDSVPPPGPVVAASVTSREAPA